MDEYARAAARVHASLRALQAVSDRLRADYSDEFTRELFNARTVRRKHRLPRMRYIAELTEMIATRCKPAGAYGLVPAAFTREIARVELEPDVKYEGELGDHQWWNELHAHQWWAEFEHINSVNDLDGASEVEELVNAPQPGPPAKQLQAVEPEAGSSGLQQTGSAAPEARAVSPKAAVSTLRPQSEPVADLEAEKEPEKEQQVDEQPSSGPNQSLEPPIPDSPHFAAAASDDDDDELILTYPGADAYSGSDVYEEAEAKPGSPLQLKTHLLTPPPSSTVSQGEAASLSPQVQHKEPESMSLASTRPPSPRAPSPAFVPARMSPILIVSRSPSPAASDMALETPPDSPATPVVPLAGPSRKRSASGADLTTTKAFKIEAMETVLGPLENSEPPAKVARAEDGQRVAPSPLPPTQRAAPSPSPSTTAPLQQVPTPVPVYYAAPSSSSAPRPAPPTTPRAAPPTAPRTALRPAASLSRPGNTAPAYSADMMQLTNHSRLAQNLAQLSLSIASATSSSRLPKQPVQTPAIHSAPSASIPTPVSSTSTSFNSDTSSHALPPKPALDRVALGRTSVRLEGGNWRARPMARGASDKPVKKEEFWPDAPPQASSSSSSAPAKPSPWSTVGRTLDPQENVFSENARRFAPAMPRVDAQWARTSAAPGPSRAGELHHPPPPSTSRSDDFHRDDHVLPPNGPPDVAPPYNAGPSEPAMPYERPVCMADDRRASCDYNMAPHEVVAHLVRVHGWHALGAPHVATYVCGPSADPFTRDEFEKRVWDVLDARVDLAPEPPVCMAPRRERGPACGAPMRARDALAHMADAHAWAPLRAPGAAQYVCGAAPADEPDRALFESRVNNIMAGIVVPKAAIKRGRRGGVNRRAKLQGFNG